ncbi:MAG: hypothetical protein ABSG21_17520 [Spirochaetia bacterium]|jgi:hypothetical protein
MKVATERVKDKGVPEGEEINAQAVIDARDSFNDRFSKASALVDLLSNCRAEQLHDETVPCIACMLSEIMEGLDTEFDSVAEAMEKDEGSP